MTFLAGSSIGLGGVEEVENAAEVLVSDGTPVIAAFSRGSARSLPTFLAAGLSPIGAQVLIRSLRAATEPA
jgi:hypothetical protein